MTDSEALALALVFLASLAVFWASYLGIMRLIRAPRRTRAISKIVNRRTWTHVG